MRFLSAVSAHRLIGPRRNEDITEELQICNICVQLCIYIGALEPEKQPWLASGSETTFVSM
jgi:hypothetical protein